MGRTLRLGPSQSLSISLKTLGVQHPIGSTTPQLSKTSGSVLIYFISRM